MIEITTMIDDYESFIQDLNLFLKGNYSKYIHFIEFIDDEVPFVRFITSLSVQEIFELSIFCGQQEMKRIYLNYSPNRVG